MKLEEEEKERAVLRVVARKEREQVMKIRDMQEEGDEEEKDGLVSILHFDWEKSMTDELPSGPLPCRYGLSRMSTTSARGV